MGATCTAQIIIGASLRGGFYGPFNGIGPFHVMYLVEGGRAAWVVENVRHQSDEDAEEPITWVPSRPERILADGLVMIAARITEEAEIQKLVRDRLEAKQAEALLEAKWADLTEIDEGDLLELENAARQAIRAKLVITTMAGSSLTGQLALLERCAIEAEVCTPSWICEHDDDGKTRTSGTLPPDDPEAHSFYEIRT